MLNKIKRENDNVINICSRKFLIKFKHNINLSLNVY